MTPLLLTISIMMSHFGNNVLVSQNMVFPKDLRKLCPHSSFCDEISDSDQYTTQTNHNNKLIPCCSSCSCAKDCGRKRNCCRYEYDLYKLEETLNTVCKQLNTGAGIGSRYEQFYHIIDKCPNRSEPCSLSDKPHLFSYSPVYSKRTGMLYYNIKCAYCHRQTELINFKPLLTCKRITESYFTSFQNGFMHSACILNFLIPKEIDLSTELCYPFLRRPCKQSTTYFGLCNSFNATFHFQGFTQYGNVYCYLCSFNTPEDHLYPMQSNEFCPSYIRQKSFRWLTFGMLLDGSSFDESSTLNVDEEKYPTWCSKANKDIHVTCRPVFCPEGQEYQRGRCKYQGRKWMFLNLRLNIKLLTLYKLFSIEDLDISPDPGNNTVMLHRQGILNYAVTLLYNRDFNSTDIIYFVAMFSKKFVTVDPQNFIEEIGKSLQENWELQINDRVVIVEPTFHKHVSYQHVEMLETFSYQPVLPPNGIGGSKKNRDDLNLVYGDEPVNYKEDLRGAFFLTKLFFCQMVELQSDEFEDVSPRLFLKKKGRHLEEGEFIWTFNEFGIMMPRVCLSDLRLTSNSPGFHEGGNLRPGFLSALCGLTLLNMLWASV